jgi:hypothetical protein
LADGEIRDPLFEVISEAVRSDLEKLAGSPSPRRMDLIGRSVVRDVGGWLLDQIPTVGSALSDAFQDNIWADMRENLTREEDQAFVEITRRWPDTVALIQTFQNLPERAW